ncbi:hypothetical protein CSKR_104215 [Clonorchis sinensis]|uniref:Uncharacterized protein n=1 Tax=Clonorchis sinensis TaxID=79923 RepID=A0A3R7D3S3_CLOSI|nr:hypothetical protein CSKR_104215 [Clonorchis sinensis]
MDPNAHKAHVYPADHKEDCPRDKLHRTRAEEHCCSVQFDRLDDANFASSPDLMFWFLIFHSLHFSCHMSGKNSLVLPSLALFLPATFKS